jgi:predicted helicase
VRTATAFWAFSKAGYDLALLHLNYETVKPYEGVTLKTPASLISSDYRVEKMRFSKDKDRTTIIYNPKITVSGIPLEAYDYVVNGRSPIEWVMDRQLVKTDKDSGIVNDANDWAIETMNNPKYPLDLLLRVITVSLETQKIITNLPTLDILDTTKDVTL